MKIVFAAYANLTDRELPGNAPDKTVVRYYRRSLGIINFFHVVVAIISLRPNDQKKRKRRRYRYNFVFKTIANFRGPAMKACNIVRALK